MPYAILGAMICLLGLFMVIFPKLSVKKEYRDNAKAVSGRGPDIIEKCIMVCLESVSVRNIFPHAFVGKEDHHFFAVSRTIRAGVCCSTYSPLVEYSSVQVSSHLADI